MTDSLQAAIGAAQGKLRDRLALASAAMEDRAATREVVQKVDAFLVNACRHTSAVCDLVLPAARRALPKGDGRVRAYVQQCKRMERALGQAKQRMYGEAHAVDKPWSEVWSTVVREYQVLSMLEQEMVADIGNVPGSVRRPNLSLAIESVTGNSPTRPHPRSPHSGVIGHLVRRLWARADRIWDAAEGRIVSDRPIATEPDELAA